MVFTRVFRNPSNSYIRMVNKYLVGVILFCTSLIVIAQEGVVFASKNAVELKVGIHNVGLPFYKMLEEPSNWSVALAFTKQLTKNESRTGLFFQNLSIGWTTNQFSSSGLVLSSNTTYRKYILKSAFLEGGVGFGVSFLRQPSEVFKIEKGVWKEVNKSFKALPVFSASISSGWKINESSEAFVHYNPYLDLFYPSLGVLPQAILSAGYRYFLLDK